MFEREADLAETEMLINCNGDYSKKKNYREGWQEGATFGYNKAKEELEAQIEKMKSDVELARDNANKTEDWETFSVLNSILDDWEIKENDI